jgi:hypothetical protein
VLCASKTAARYKLKRVWCGERKQARTIKHAVDVAMNITPIPNPEHASGKANEQEQENWVRASRWP